MADTPTHTEPTGPQGGGGRMVLVMGSVGLVASIILVVTYQVTLPYIEENRRAYLEAAILDVIPGATSFAPLELREDGLSVASEFGGLYAGFDSSGQTAGVAIEAKGQGYADVISLLYGYSPACECIVGMKVLESKETPGLGDKIEKDPAFRRNFEALDATLAPDGIRLLHDIEMAKRGEKEEPWQIEAITGATVSSKAITQIIGASAAQLVPSIRKYADQIQPVGGS